MEGRDAVPLVAGVGVLAVEEVWRCIMILPVAGLLGAGAAAVDGDAAAADGAALSAAGCVFLAKKGD